ncbi:MAG: acetate--CoA ligase family protein, partial [Thermoleophilia bacterium]|nr:acetate--CoA ligase family protein [Thermoleophilia bacterium]
DDVTNGTATPQGEAPAHAPTHARRALPERESLELLRAAGLAVVEAWVAVDPEGAVAVAAAFGAGPVVLKLDAVGLAHKSDVGAVRLGLVGSAAVRAAAADLLQLGRGRDLDVRGLLVEPMARPGLELIVGATRDPLFGPTVMVGLGGVFTEVLDDVAIRLAPLDRADALAMLDDLRGRVLLDGARGRPSVDRGAVADLVVALARLAWERPDIIEVDLNPVIAGADGALAVDALVVLAGDRDG